MRECGECQLCCRLLPVMELKKGAVTRCRHQKFGAGCTIYEHRPRECVLWACAWQREARGLDVPRPDRAHFIVDIMLDCVTLDVEGTSVEYHALQIWIDPRYPKAHRHDGLRAFLHHANLYGANLVGLVRYNSKDAIALLSPSFTGRDHWLELGNCSIRNPTPGEKLAKLE